MSENYTNREIDRMFTEIKDSLARIEEQTKNTTTRVGSLENWRYLLSGGLIIISMFVIPMAIYIFNNQSAKAQVTAAAVNTIPLQR